MHAPAAEYGAGRPVIVVRPHEITMRDAIGVGKNQIIRGGFLHCLVYCSRPAIPFVLLEDVFRMGNEDR